MASQCLSEMDNDGMQITKLEVAAHQLNVAIRLFLESDYLSSLTLAGAAEEILGKISKRTGMPVAVESIIQYHLPDTDPALFIHLIACSYFLGHFCRFTETLVKAD